MKRKTQRLYFVALGLLALATGTALVLTAFQDNIVFFFSPSEIKQQAVSPGQRIRIGGLVAEGSVIKSGETVSFVVTDTVETLAVNYRGILPDLFREGQGIVAEGRLIGNGTFEASDVLAKHDENYMPREVADAIKEAGQWQDQSGMEQSEADSVSAAP